MQKFGSASPWCVIVHQTLFSLSFGRVNTTMGMPHFHGENPVEFWGWGIMAHQQGFSSVYTACIDMLVLWRAEALQSIKHVDACRIHEETNVTWWHGLRQSHCDDHAHNIAWICTYENCLERIPTLQGQELSWLERVTHVAMRVHHTKCTITHIQADIDIHTTCII